MKIHSLFRSGFVGIVLLPTFAFAQNVANAYDVSTVRPHDPNDHNMIWSANVDGFRAINVLLKYVIVDAWHLRPDQISGEPSWVDDLHWDITGKSTELTLEQLKKLTPTQVRQMTEQLLAERFHLKAHIETRTGPVYTLIPAKGGIKIKPIAMTEEQKATGKVDDSSLSVMGGESAVMDANKIALPSLLENLSVNLRQTVIDKSGLPADSVYTFTLRWDPDNGTAPNASSDAPLLPTALEEQLGLHLQSSKGPVQLLVIDHIEKPTDN